MPTHQKQQQIIRADGEKGSKFIETKPPGVFSFDGLPSKAMPVLTNKQILMNLLRERGEAGTDDEKERMAQELFEKF